MEIQDFLAEKIRIEWDTYDVFVIVKGSTEVVSPLHPHLIEFADEISGVVQKYFPGWRTRLTTATSDRAGRR